MTWAADAKAFDGKPFNGRTVAEYLGNQGAAIAAIANIVALLINEPSEDESDRDDRAFDERPDNGDANF